MNLFAISTFIAAILTVSYANPTIRFVNAIENTTLDIYTNEFKTFTLNYTEVSSYIETLSNGTLQVTNVVNHDTQESLIGSIPQLVSFPYNATIAIYQKNGTTYLILFNETSPSIIEDSKCWVKLVDLGYTANLITLASVSGDIVSYVGPLVNSPYVNVDPTTTSLRIYNSSTGSYNTPDITLSTQLNATNAYTVFYFEPSTGPMAEIVFDRSFAGALNVTSPITTSRLNSTSGRQITSGKHLTSSMVTSGKKATSGIEMTTGIKATSTSSKSTASTTTSSTTAPLIIFQSSSAEKILISSTILFAILLVC